MELIPILAFATLGLAIVFAIWSKAKTEKKLNNEASKKSSLARDTPDPRFQPDPTVTDPANINRSR